MKGQNFPDPAARLPTVVANGAHPATRKSRAAKRPTGSGGPAGRDSAPHPVEADFAVIAGEPIDTPMWPRHAASWLQVERTPATGLWTGLTIERRNRIPAPGFLESEIAPMDRPGAIDSSRDPLHTPLRLAFPLSDLAPLGWDPRAACRNHEGEPI